MLKGRPTAAEAKAPETPPPAKPPKQLDVAEAFIHAAMRNALNG